MSYPFFTALLSPSVRWLLLFAVGCVCLQTRASESIELSWQPSGSGVAGFTIFYGTSSHTYNNSVNAGNTNQVVIPGLTFGTTYYFAARAYDSAGDVSALSDEVSFVAGSATLTPTILTGHRMSFALHGTSGQSYIVQYSTNLVNWVTFLTNTAPFVYTNTPNPAIGQQYFRSYRYN